MARTADHAAESERRGRELSRLRKLIYDNALRGLVETTDEYEPGGTWEDRSVEAIKRLRQELTSLRQAAAAVVEEAKRRYATPEELHMAGASLHALQGAMMRQAGNSIPEPLKHKIDSLARVLGEKP